GLGWYEVSNWSRDDASRCEHNRLYWRGDDWWGAGPGAHSHVGGVRWWNVKHPAAYADRLAAGVSPALAREVLGPEDRRVERVLLELRLRDGLPVDVLDDAGRAAVPGLAARGLLDDEGGRLVLTRAGRLLADGVVRDLLP
ncbi:MAG: radical SAM family heme chaperone HemW, partial [Nocardioides sp.]